MSRRIFLLGSTGSIGRSTIEVVEHLREQHGEDAPRIVALSAGQNADLLLEQARLLGADLTAIASEDDRMTCCGEQAAATLVREHAREGDLVVAAIVGASGIAPVLTAIEQGCDVALANKESLVAAGTLVMSAAAARGVRVLPIDSEHSAIFQCHAIEDRSAIARVVLTASGGALRDMPVDEMGDASVEQVLAHPTWNMGPKVTVDSASLMNKALEIIEAHWLFGLESERIDVLIHPQSIVHGMVEFADGSMIAQLGAPDMRLPIQHAITWPRRLEGCGTRVDLQMLSSLEFRAPDEDRYRALPLARGIIDRGGTAGAIFNAANEVAVAAFLQGQLPFGSIMHIVEQVLRDVEATPAADLESVMASDARARVAASEAMGAAVQRD